MPADESRVSIPVMPGINCLFATRSPAVRSGHIMDVVGKVKFLERVLGGICVFTTEYALISIDIRTCPPGSFGRRA